VNLAKKMGLKKLFYGRPGRGEIEKISQEDLYWLASQLAEDYSKLPIEFKHPNILSPAHIYNDSKDSSY